MKVTDPAKVTDSTEMWMVGDFIHLVGGGWEIDVLDNQLGDDIRMTFWAGGPVVSIAVTKSGLEVSLREKFIKEGDK